MRFLEGDGVQLFFDDPHEVPDAPLHAIRLACSLREEMADVDADLAEARVRARSGRRHRARLRDVRGGRVRGASDYAAIGAVTNLAARPADQAAAGQVLIAQRLSRRSRTEVEVDPSASSR